MSGCQGALLLGAKSCLADVSSNASVHSFHRGIMNGIDRDRGAIMIGGETIFSQRLSHLFHVLAVCLTLSPLVHAQVQPFRTFHHASPAQIYGAALSPDGTKVVTGCAGAKVWDVHTGEVIVNLHEEGNYVTAAAFSADGKRVATGDLDGHAMIWHIESGQKIRDFSFGPWSRPLTPDAVAAVALSAEGRYLAAGSDVVKVWDTDSGEEILVVPGSLHILSHYLAFFPDGKRLLIRWDWNEVYWGGAWDIQTGSVVSTFEGGQATLSADGKRVLTRPGGPAPYKIWDAETGELLFTIPESDPRHKPVTLSADGTKVLYKLDSGLRMVDAQRGAALRDFSGQLVEHQGFSLDGKLMLTVGRDSVYVWDISDLTSAVGDAALYNR